jgi:hypothetical protein
LLRAGPEGEELAHYQGGVWSAAEFNSPRYVVSGSTCTLRFEEERGEDSVVVGPVDKVEIVDGAVYSHPGRCLVALLNEEKGAWYAYSHWRSWPSLVIERSAPGGSS